MAKETLTQTQIEELEKERIDEAIRAELRKEAHALMRQSEDICNRAHAYKGEVRIALMKAANCIYKAGAKIFDEIIYGERQ